MGCASSAQVIDEHFEHHDRKTMVSINVAASSTTHSRHPMHNHQGHNGNRHLFGVYDDLVSQRQNNTTYAIISDLGKGAFGCVRTARDLRTNQLVAIKTIELSARSAEREPAILRAIGKHKYVAAMLDIYTTDDHVHLVLEHCAGGTLADRISDGTYLDNESLLRKHFFQVALGLKHCHSSGVIHQDLKPANILFVNNDPNSSVKLCDFGLSQFLRAGQKLTSTRGTKAYLPPEVLDSSRPGYTEKLDSWSFGVTLYFAVAGYHPFDPSGKGKKDEVLGRIARCEYDFKDPCWQYVSDDVQDLISRCLELNQHNRASMDEIIGHEWFAELQ